MSRYHALCSARWALHDRLNESGLSCWSFSVHHGFSKDLVSPNMKQERSDATNGAPGHTTNGATKGLATMNKCLTSSNKNARNGAPGLTTRRHKGHRY